LSTKFSFCTKFSIAVEPGRKAQVASTAARWIKKNRLTARGLRGHNFTDRVGSARGADQRKTNAQTDVADLG
jgi:hypothetical protein